MTGVYHIKLPEEEDIRRRPLGAGWIGVGCVLVVGLPALGYLLAEYLLQVNFQFHYVYLPPEVAWPPAAPYLLVKLTFAALALLLGTAMFSFLYGLMAPIRPGKYDARDQKKPLARIRRWR